MTAGVSPAPGHLWSVVGEALGGHGWRWRVVAVERLADVAERVSAALHSIGLDARSADSDGELLEIAHAALPSELPEGRSIVIGAVGRPVTPALLVVAGSERTVTIPPHYAGYHMTPRRFTALVDEALAACGHRAVTAELPLKTLATGSGLALYGRNNITYVPGLGSYVALAACVTDAPAPTDVEWHEPRLLKACLRCFACARICPTAAITGESFVIHHDRCLTTLNESDEPFPDWVQPQWHTCAVGCMECQRVCPQNWPDRLVTEPPVRFDETESAAILAGDGAALARLAATGSDVRDRLAACGLDYEPGPMARNLRALLAAGTVRGESP